MSGYAMRETFRRQQRALDSKTQGSGHVTPAGHRVLSALSSARMRPNRAKMTATQAKSCFMATSFH